ncbi:NAC domain containing protein 52-like [Phragmites australis]|uniref:NAC domain containing protein 52-like n=1 Tax=Phragmites australis TaxID=29695 RepID=UPI002D7759AA|nr:NAC domain containing protein 52-like [Phragmites australis]
MEAPPAPAATDSISDALKKIEEFDPSTATDQDILDYHQEFLVTYKGMAAVNAGLAQLDPWDLQLPQCYVMTKQEGCCSRQQTQLGYWKDCGRIAIRPNALSPEYTGHRMTYEFHMEDGTKTNWLMYEYSLLEKDKCRRRFVLQDDQVVRKVFHKYGDGVARSLKKLYGVLNNSDEEEEYKYNNGEPDDDRLHRCIASFRDCLLNHVPSNQKRPGKRRRSTATDGKLDVWQHLTKIYTTDPDVVFAVCHYCDKLFKAHSKNGTTHLRRHSKKCSCKHQQQSSS